MKNVILFDDDSRENFLPLTYTRPMSELRCGILTIREKWEIILDTTITHITQNYLQDKFPLKVSKDNLLINGALLPNSDNIKLINSLQLGEAIISDQELIAARLDDEKFDRLCKNEPIDDLIGTRLEQGKDHLKLYHSWELFSNNHNEIINDFELITKDKTSEPLHSSNIVIGDYPVFLEKGAKAHASIFNTQSGPIYIGKDAEVMEGCMVRGPLAMNNNSVLKMGAKIYGATTIGPYCKVGGEVNNSIFIGYSNKGHDGFLGNSVIGEWCNLGADTNNSNLKNNYAEVKLWNYRKERFIPTGLQFCGLIMGDHSKCGINTMLNTGTVIGVSCNIYGAGFPRNFVPSFSWGSAQGYTSYKLSKANETAERMMSRRSVPYEEIDKEILRYIYEKDAKYRTWDK